MKAKVKPIWLRSVTSHSSAPPSSIPAATVAAFSGSRISDRETKPQTRISSVGQYITSSTRGQERR
jgi:hypothetical protein